MCFPNHPFHEQSQQYVGFLPIQTRENDLGNYFKELKNRGDVQLKNPRKEG